MDAINFGGRRLGRFPTTRTARCTSGRGCRSCCGTSIVDEPDVVVDEVAGVAEDVVDEVGHEERREQQRRDPEEAKVKVLLQ